MSGRETRSDIDRRVEDVRRSLRERHSGIEADAGFAARVIARLPRDEAWAFDWAARRILPVSIGLAMVLMIAVMATGGFARRAPATASASPTSQSGSDPLDWLLEGRQELR